MIKVMERALKRALKDIWEEVSIERNKLKVKDQKKAGVIIQYFNIVLNMAIGIFFTPFLIRSLGSAEYGLYRIVQSFAGQLGIMTFGISILVTRNIVRFNTLNQRKEKENFLAMAAIISGILAIGVLLVGFILSFGIDTLFDQSLTSSELSLAKQLYWILIINVAMTILNDMATGMVSGHEKFVVKNGVTTLKYVLRVLTLILLLKLGFGSVAIVMTDLGLTILVFVINMLYSKFVLNETIRFYYLDKQEMKNALTFSFAILLQAIVNQVNQNLDSIILGAMTDTNTVAVYSVALNLFTMFNSITLVIGTVFTPQATRMIMNHATGEELTDLVIKPGRLQFMIGSLLITGYILFGKEFIKFWVGSEFYGAYIIGIILMIPALIPLIQNVTSAILDAMMKRLGRSLILVVMAGANIVVSIVCVHFFGYIGAAFGTAFSYIVGNLILMNIYLYKVTELNLKRMYKELLSKSMIVAIVCPIICIPLSGWGPSRLWMLLLKMGVYVFIYGLTMFFFAMRDYEKNMFLALIKKILKRK